MTGQDPAITMHTPENREKLRHAGLSQASELRPNQLERLSNLPLDTAQKMSERQVRAAIYGEAVMKESGGSRQTTFDLAVEMLKARGPMHYRDLAEALVKSGKVTPKGKTFPQTLSAELTRKRGKGVERVGPGVYAVQVDGDE
jgi:hypothetical protein